MTDKLIRFVASKAQFRGAVVSMPVAANTIFHQHEPTQDMGEYLCNTAVAALLLASCIKTGAVSISIESNGIIGIMNADATPDGLVRAMIAKANVEDEALSRKLKLPLMGKGTLSVIKKLSEDSPPYRGVIEIDEHYIGPMIADYLLYSEQIKSSVSTATAFHRTDVQKCYGFYVEALPGLAEDDLHKIEKNIVGMGNFHEFIGNIKQPEELMEEL